MPPKKRAASKAVVNTSAYVCGENNAFIVDYAEPQRSGKRVSTGFVESAVNQVLAKRFAERQQRQWIKKGTHLLGQARTKVLDEEWQYCFRLQYPGFRPLLAEALHNASYMDYVWEDLFNERSGSQQQSARKANNLRPHAPARAFLVQYFRKSIETCFRQLTARFPKHIHAVTGAGFVLKLALFVFAHFLDQPGL